MLIRTRCLVIATGLLFLLSSAANAAIVQNFETGTIAPGITAFTLLNLQNEDQAMVLNNPRFPDNAFGHPQAVSYFDHTDGNANGFMFAVNGTELGAAKLAYSQVVSTGIVANTFQVVGLWVSTWSQTPPAGLRLDVTPAGGATTSVSFNAPATAGVWTFFSSGPIAIGAIPTLTLSIFNTTSFVNGNDFALDDISVNETIVPEPGTLTLTGFGALLGLAAFGWRRRKAIRSA